MYFSIGIILIILLLCIVLGICRRRASIQKVCSLCAEEKCELLSVLIEPFGYCYDGLYDIISSRNDAWQREAGYTALFDRAALHFNMVFDCQPIYFNYQERTWLIEFWKGQYGINTGAEIGLYYADHILTKRELSSAHFQAVEDKDMLSMSLCLIKDEAPLAALSRRTWWLTAFCMGEFSHPEQLSLNLSLTFPDCDMMYSFLEALHAADIPRSCIRVCGMQVQISYSPDALRPSGLLRRLRYRFTQFINRFFCRIYLRITRPFCLTSDRLLYLYYLLPFAFRRMLTPRRYHGFKRI